jgi:glycerol-3-phosphate dehydrogenase
MVRDFSFILPLTGDDPFFGIKAGIGLALYDLLAWNVSGSHKHSHINKREVLESVPGLSAKNINGGLRFHDCITDDSRLVLEVIKSACAEGAIAINYVEVKGINTEAGKIKGLVCHDRYSGAPIEVRCRTVVNAGGVWSDTVTQMIDTSWKNRIAPAKGVHIVVPQSAFETNSALFLPTKDKRYVFVVPWQRALMIGTTDTLYSGRLEQPLPVAQEVDYLLGVVNEYSAYPLTKKDVIAAWAGLRPLIGDGVTAQAGSSTSNLSREHEIVEHKAGMVGLIGGKLTNYRIMAEQVVSKVVAYLPDERGASLKQSRTQRIMLGGWTDKTDFLTVTAGIAARARKLGIEPANLEHLTASYGKDAELVLDLVEKEPGLNSRICSDFPPIMAEIPFCVLHEMAVSLEDLLCRRIRLGIVHQKQCLDAAPKVAMLLQTLLGWDKSRTDIELAALEKSLKEHMESFGKVEAPKA